MLPFDQINTDWTLFLDRDGVINEEKHNEYIHTWDEFRFYEGVPQAIADLGRCFKYVVVITNQKGVGKGVTKLEDLHLIHKNLKEAIIHAGGRIDGIYYCPDIDEESPNRKPNPGMGLQAVKDLPEIDLSHTIMVGNTLSDMQFGRNLGAYTVFLPTTRKEVDITDPRIDAVCSDLVEFARIVCAGKL